MKGGGLRRLSYLLPISLLVVLTLIAAGCSGPDDKMPADEPNYKVSFDDTGSRVITVKEGIGHFSMVYPDGFKLDIIKIDNSGGREKLFVDFIGPATPDVIVPGIHIYASVYDDSFTSGQAAESLLNLARNYNNFRLLNESMLTVAGVTAYQHYYYSDEYPYDLHFIKPSEEELILVTWLTRAVFFNHSGLSWTIRMLSDPSREEHDMAVFDRILDSFKVLD